MRIGNDFVCRSVRRRNEGLPKLRAGGTHVLAALELLLGRSVMVLPATWLPLAPKSSPNSFGRTRPAEISLTLPFTPIPLTPSTSPK